MNKLSTLAAFAIIGALLGAELKDTEPVDTTPPAAPSPERQVIPTEDDAAEHGKAEPQEDASVWYSSYSAAVLDASETGRALRVVVAETQPESDPAPHVGCWLPLPDPPKTFAGYDVPCDLITREFERDADRVTPINLKPYER